MVELDGTGLTHRDELFGGIPVPSVWVAALVVPEPAHIVVEVARPLWVPIEGRWVIGRPYIRVPDQVRRRRRVENAKL